MDEARVDAGDGVPLPTKLRFSANYTQPRLWRRVLADFRDQPDIRMLEIGCYEGRSTIWFLRHVLTHETSQITCIDPFTKPCKPYVSGERPTAAAIFANNLQLAGLRDKVWLQPGYSHDILPGLKQSYHAIYVDGDHRSAAVMTDAVLSWLLLRHQGILIFDDYPWQGGRTPQDRPRIAIDAFLRTFAGQYQLLHKGWQVVVRKLSTGEHPA